jgi:uncharacterized RDD family membrane protein YckC
MPKKKTQRKARVKKNYAGFWIRVGAHIVDGIIMYITGLLYGLIIGLSGINSSILTIGGAIAISWLYYAGLESSEKQATFGKQLFGLKVVNEKYKRISFGQATMRIIGKFFSGVILGIGYIMIAFSEKKQGLHDLIAQTYVLKC